MGADRQHRLDDRELKRLLDELTRPEFDGETPGKSTLAEHLDQVALIFRHRPAKASSKAHVGSGAPRPGQRALVGDMLMAVPKLEFADCRAWALRDVLSRLGKNRQLQEETLAAADPQVARRVAGGECRAQATAGGQALWGAANQRAVTLYRRATATGIGALETRPVAEAVGAIGTGVPLPDDVRRKLEAALKVSLESVRLHTGAVARDAASAVNAEAFTVGEDIFFPGYDPSSSQCHETLAHEVVHCIQWRQGRITALAGGLGVSRPDDPLEREAEHQAKSIVAHAFHGQAEPVRIAGRTAQRTFSTQPSPSTVAATSAPVSTASISRGPGVHMVMRKAGSDHPVSERPVPQWRAEIPIGFIDHRDGAEVLTAPAEQGGKAVGKLAPAARVWVNGAHPTAKDWLQVTEVPATRQAAGTPMAQGYVRASRVVTRLPEPGAVLYQVTSSDTPEKLAARKYGHLVRAGRDLRFYENVLLYVNQQEKRKGVAGTPQTTDVFGQRSNGIQLVAGERIWLVSAEYAELFAGTVGSGSLTGGLAGSGKHAWYQNPVLDLFKSSLWAPQQTVEDVAGEYSELLTKNMGAIAGTIGGILFAEAVAWGTVAIPVCGPIISAMLHLGIAAFGIVVADEAIEASAGHGKYWIELAWTAKGDSEQLEEASREWWRMWVTLLLAGGAGKGAVRSIRKAGKYFNAPPRAGKGGGTGAATAANPRDLHMTKLEETEGVGADGRPVTHLRYEYGTDASAKAASTPATRTGTPPSRRLLGDDPLPAGIPAMAGGAPEKRERVAKGKVLVPKKESSATGEQKKSAPLDAVGPRRHEQNEVGWHNDAGEFSRQSPQYMVDQITHDVLRVSPGLNRGEVHRLVTEAVDDLLGQIQQLEMALAKEGNPGVRVEFEYWDQAESIRLRLANTPHKFDLGFSAYDTVEKSHPSGTTYKMPVQRAFRSIAELRHTLEVSFRARAQKQFRHILQVARGFGWRKVSEDSHPREAVARSKKLPGFESVIKEPNKTVKVFRGESSDRLASVLRDGLFGRLASTKELDRFLGLPLAERLGYIEGQANFRKGGTLLQSLPMGGGKSVFTGASGGRSGASFYAEAYVIEAEIPEEVIVDQKTLPVNYRSEVEQLIPFLIAPEWIKRVWSKDGSKVWDVRDGQLLPHTNPEQHGAGGEAIPTVKMGPPDEATLDKRSLPVEQTTSPTNAALRKWAEDKVRISGNSVVRGEFLRDFIKKNPVFHDMLQATAPKYLDTFELPDPVTFTRNYIAYLDKLGIPNQHRILPGQIFSKGEGEGAKYRFLPYGAEPPEGFKIHTGIVSPELAIRAMNEGISPTEWGTAYDEKFAMYLVHHDLAHLASYTNLLYLTGLRDLSKFLVGKMDDPDVRLKANRHVLNILRVQDLYEDFHLYSSRKPCATFAVSRSYQ